MVFNDVLYRIMVGGEITRDIRVETSDKEQVKHYAVALIGADKVVPTLDVLRTPEDIDAFEVCVACVVKPTHGSGGVHRLSPQDLPDRVRMKEQLAQNYYHVHRERNYKDLPGKLIVEPLLFDGRPVHDYKIFCWQGQPRCIRYVNDRNRLHYKVMLDVNWRKLPVPVLQSVTNPPSPPRPDCLDEMLAAASKLAQPFSLVRIDFYAEDNQVLLGEITHLHNAASERFASYEDELTLSRHLFGSDLAPSRIAMR